MVIDNEDLGLIEGFLKGNEECFNKIVRKYQEKVYYLALRILGNHHDAEDVSSETFVRVYKHLKHLKEKQYFSTWLYRITLNLCYTKRKENKYYEEISILKKISDSKATYHNFQIEEEDIKNKIKEVLKTLPKQQQTTFILRVYEGFKFEEIAKIMGLSIGGVKSNYFKAVEKIKEGVKKFL